MNKTKNLNTGSSQNYNKHVDDDEDDDDHQETIGYNFDIDGDDFVHEEDVDEHELTPWEIAKVEDKIRMSLV
ncbi:hypothetical protein Tco_0592933 [Tanacetum coccineum]